jgi:hypothetical protein
MDIQVSDIEEINKKGNNEYKIFIIKSLYFRDIVP